MHSNKIVQIEKHRDHWAAKFKKMVSEDREAPAHFAAGMLRGLEFALIIIKQPSNAAIQTDELPCKNIRGCEFIEQWCQYGQCDFFTPTKIVDEWNRSKHKGYIDSIDAEDGYWFCGICHTIHAKQYDSDHCCQCV